MDISSSGESPFVVAARAPSASSFSARDANSRIVNNYYKLSKDPRWSPSEEIARAKSSESGKL